MESVGRNYQVIMETVYCGGVALRMESVGRNRMLLTDIDRYPNLSLSAWRAWVEILTCFYAQK